MALTVTKEEDLIGLEYPVWVESWGIGDHVVLRLWDNSYYSESGVIEGFLDMLEYYVQMASNKDYALDGWLVKDKEGNWIFRLHDILTKEEFASGFKTQDREHRLLRFDRVFEELKTPLNLEMNPGGWAYNNDDLLLFFRSCIKAKGSMLING